MALNNTSYAQHVNQENITITRLGNGQIIGSDTHPSIGENIQGLPLIKVPKCIDNPLGKCNLFLADHKRYYIRQAYADDLLGSRQTHEVSSLQLKDSHLSETPPFIAEDRLAKLVAE
jgi:hypothetical protein